jgi:hypothetical protein
VSKIVWNTSEPPKDRRLLMIVTPIGVTKDLHSIVQPKQDVVVGHWNYAREAYVQVAVPDEFEREVRAELEVSYWAEINLPLGINLRPLADEDTKG